MFRNPTVVFTIVVALVLSTAVAFAEIPDLDLSTASVATSGAVLFSRIDGNGDAFTMAHMGGVEVDATITLNLHNYLDDPLVNYPAEDLWLETSAGGLMGCTPLIADAPTDAAGQTMWQQPIPAGGCSIGETVNVMVAGNPLNHAGMALEFVSGDLNSDFVVNLADLSVFATAYQGTYSACSDLFADGIMNLTDLSYFAASYGNVCP